MSNIKDVLDRLTTLLAARVYPDGGAPDHHQFGEWLLQLEMLAENVYERDVAATAEELDLAREAARCMLDVETATRAVLVLASAGPPDHDGRYRRRILSFAYCARPNFNVHEALTRAISSPSSSASTRDVLPETSAVDAAMPRELHLWDWNVFEAQDPTAARLLLLALLDAATRLPGAAVSLFGPALSPLDLREVLARLQQRG